MSRYNANGGLRRSGKLELVTPKLDRESLQFMVGLIETKAKFGLEITLEALNRYAEKYELTAEELASLVAIVKDSDDQNP